MFEHTQLNPELTTDRERGPETPVLRTLVGTADENGESVHVFQVAESMECDPELVERPLDSLTRYEFVRALGGGRYEPTVTGRQFLGLDIDENSFVVVDTPEDRS